MISIIVILTGVDLYLIIQNSTYSQPVLIGTNDLGHIYFTAHVEIYDYSHRNYIAEHDQFGYSVRYQSHSSTLQINQNLFVINGKTNEQYPIAGIYELKNDGSTITISTPLIIDMVGSNTVDLQFQVINKTTNKIVTTNDIPVNIETISLADGLQQDALNIQRQNIFFTAMIGVVTAIGVYLSYDNSRKIEETQRKQIDILKNQHDSQRQQFFSQAMLTCFNILSNSDIRSCKEIIGQERRDRMEHKKSLIFNEDGIKNCADKIEEAYNEVSALYLLDLLNKENFRTVYGGGLVIWWKVMKDDIKEKQKKSPKIGKHFEDVADELMKAGINDEPY
ncbi:protein of unknown function [Nitrosotalea devaniterrae]|uniref:Uncharacterized protein n=1 Tax=Nitrosotalea devaniterrae TaxID=1078905 RepID=A0A128A628_9ARCH|nr:protein of unknown function [Candidatus Nitrosotalea devanaterra]